ncbi:MAG: hypothetical protein QMD04_11840 [Anaerolineales bacterium]|nr:hypothetical protein [Anaerolineales bacterium]
MKRRKTTRLMLAVLALAALACEFSAPTAPVADPNAFNTMVALTAQVAQIQTQAALPPPATNIPPPAGPSPVAPPSAVPTLTDEQAIKQALLAKLGWTEAELEFSLSQNTGQFAQGSLKRTTEQGGAAWFAAKDASGKWVIAYIGHGIPMCSEVDPFNIPIAWISHCMDASYNTIQRGAAPPPPTAADVFAPDPLGPAWSGMWFANGACYDMDVLFTDSGTACDVYLDSTGLLRPRNGGLFSGYATLTPPSLNQCKAAQLSADPIAPNSDLYMCFKTNLGKYGFFVARQIDASGIAFDAYVFP